MSDQPNSGFAPRETDERFVYDVPSSQNPRICYRVDLTAENGYSKCACVDWATRRWPNIKAGAPIGTRETMCRHVIAARNKFLNDLLVRLAKKEDQT